MRLNRIISTFAIILLLTASFGFSVLADETDDNTTQSEITVIETGQIGDNAIYTLTSDGLLTISGTGSTYNYNPSSNNFSPLGYLSEYITSAVIKTGIESIGNNLFNSVDKLVDVSIPNSVTSIGSYAFMHCYSLGDIKIPASVTRINSYAFYNSGITSISIPDSVTYIGSYAFDSCPNLEVIPGILNENMKLTLNKTTGEFHFSGTGPMPGYDVVNNSYAPYNSHRPYVKHIILDEGITTVGDFTFWQFGEVETVQLPSTITYIGASAFQQNSKLKSINIPSGVTYIGQQAFDGCPVLENVVLPSELQTIGMYAFRDCTILFTELTIPASVTSVGAYAFQSMQSLETLNWNSNANILASSFENCPNLNVVNINGTPKTIDSYAFKDCISLTSIKIPNGTERINGAFENNTSLTQVELPNTVTHLNGSFSGCTALTEITLPDSLVYLGSLTFNECTSLSSVSIPSNVTEIHEKAFYNCSKLQSLELPDSLTYIGQYAFYGCSLFDKITLPEALTTVEKYAFLLCDNLIEIRVLNPSCNLTNPCLPDGLTLYGYDGSPAHDYALLYEYTYISLGKSDLSFFKTYLPDQVYRYNGKAHLPTLTITGLTEGTDYTISYFDNINAGTALITATGMGNFTGTTSATFTIHPVSFSSNVSITLVNGTDYIYTGEEIFPQVLVTSKLTSEQLVEGVDYTISYSNNIDLGTGTITLSGLNNYYTTYSYDKANISFKIVPIPLETTNPTLTVTKYTYTGSEIEPEVTIDGLREFYDYQVYYSNNIEVGTGTITIKGCGIYDGEVILTFTILPKEAILFPSPLSNLKAGLFGSYNTVKLTWSPSELADGYDVYYRKSTDTDFKRLAVTTECSIKKSNLEEGIEYVFMVTPYRIDNSRKLIGKASDKITVTTLSRPSGLTFTPLSSSFFKLSWMRLNGVSGYQISQSSSRYKTNIIATTNDHSLKLEVTPNKNYYYKIRSYTTVGNTRIYSPWSEISSYNFKKPVTQIKVTSIISRYKNQLQYIVRLMKIF